MSEWIEHDGKGMPVDGETRVFVKFADDITAGHQHFVRAQYWSNAEDEEPDHRFSNWIWPENGEPEPYNIVAYMIFDGEEE